jgi:DNA helicase IV
MLVRRSAGPMTILGDIAQAAGPISYTGWKELVRGVSTDTPFLVEELRLAYRVPRDVLELELPLLPLIAPDVAAPMAYRDGDEPARFVRAGPEHVVATAVREAGHEALREGRTALIVPAELVTELEPLVPHPDTAFDELAAAIQVLTPRQAKGLEFDHVVVVEPARIAAHGDRVEGLRALYVALTRATKTLVVVHAEPLPAELRKSSRSLRKSARAGS